MNMTDEELDRDWKPSGRRPQSTIARSFSQELMDIFRIENSVADLDEKVDKRKQQVSQQTTELEALEARIKEMEARLKGSSPTSSSATQQRPPSSSAAGSTSTGSPRAQRPLASSVFDAAQPQVEKDYPVRGPQQAQAAQRRPVPEKEEVKGSRPGTARQQQQQAVPGQLPPTPTASSGEDEDEDTEEESSVEDSD